MKFRNPPSESSGGSLPFLKIKDGEKIAGVFIGEPYEFYQVWADKKIVEPGTKGASFRFRVNFVTKEGATYVAKVWEQGATVYNMLRDLNESYPLEETVVEVRRTGSTKDDTRYSILPLPPKNQPTEKGWAVIKQTKLNELGPKKDKDKCEDAPWPDEPPPELEQEELPF